MIDKHESVTAKLCSFIRAFHSINAKNKVFDDYLAYDLMGQKEYIKAGQLIEHGFNQDLYDENEVFYKSKVEPVVNTYMAPIVLARIAYSEDLVKSFKQKYEKIQYVILGAGLDTFSFRNADSGIEIFELDHADTGTYKKNRIKELSLVIPKNLHFLSIDFNKESLDEVLLKGGFNANIPTVFTILGVSYYLTLDTFEQSLSLIDKVSKAHTLVIFDYPDETTFRTQDERVKVLLSSMTENLGEKVLHGYSYQELEEALLRHNFSVLENITPGLMDEKFYKKTNGEIKAFSNIHIMTGVKNE